jgi:signal transduction histidine kinase
MSYRAFKHLLGETSLERKCRFLLGAGILVLISTSFWLFALQTESLMDKQTVNTGRLLINPIVAKQHIKTVPQENIGEYDWRLALEEFQQKVEKHWPEALSQYEHRFIKPKPRKSEHEPTDRFDRQVLAEFLEDEGKFEANRVGEESRQATGATADADRFFYYYGAIRATQACLNCHYHQRTAEEKKELGELKEGGLMAVVRIRMRTKSIEEGVHFNRAVLISTALVTALLIMTGSYLIIRYVVVKPVKHLKEVSDAIAAGELNVRSEIQTGDEFEDLSHAFNRMLRNLVSMQDRLRKVNTDLDRKVDELARANLALYESNKLKSDFLATMSHELRTPLNSILGFSEVLLSSQALNDKQQRWVQNIRSSGERLLNLINDILDLAKIEAGKLEVRLEDVAVSDICDEQVAMFRPLAQKKNIDLRSQIEPEIPLLKQDMGKLQQILSNLLSNAIKFTPEGGRVLLKGQADGLHLVLTVTDTGVGIGPEDQELVFERFRQAGNPLTREHAGTGLGLSIVRELCKLLGGEVTLKSELGRGSTFTVRLPLHIQEETRLEFDLSPDRLYAGMLPADAGRTWGGGASQEAGIRSQESAVSSQEPTNAPGGDGDNGKGTPEGNGNAAAPAANQPTQS